MKKLLLAIAAIAVIVLPPASADARPGHHQDKPVIQRVIDWD